METKNFKRFIQIEPNQIRVRRGEQQFIFFKETWIRFDRAELQMNRINLFFL